MSAFTHVPEAPADPILGLNQAFKNDPTPTKLSLGVGAYRTEEGKPWVLASVKQAEEIVTKSAEFNKEYLAIEGHEGFNKACAELLFGDLYPSLKSKVVTTQALSGTGALRIGAEFIKKYLNGATAYISDPTWPNHKNIFNAAGVPWKTYRYYNPSNVSLNFEGMCEDLKNAPNGSVVVLHGCAHNPTGLDPTKKQWEILAEIFAEKKLFPFFDCAYQGFASGDLDVDAYSVRLFASKGFEMLVSQSFAKNMGLYGERVGGFHIVCSSDSVTKAVMSQVKQVIRANYSSPPLHGALLAFLVLTTPDLNKLWRKELKEMADRIALMRTLLYEDLKARGIDWPHVTSQIGMFSYTGMNAKHVDYLIKKHHIYLTMDGRISMAGLNKKVVPIFASAVQDALQNAEKANL